MKKVKIITNCPSCDSLLVRVVDQLFCKNKDCTASKSKQVIHFCKTMKIKGLGEKTIEKLGIEDINDIYSMSSEYIISTIGEALGTKLVKEIELSKNTTIDKLLPAFSIPLIGVTASKKLSSITDIQDITYDVCRNVGIGDKASTNLENWVVTEYLEYSDLPISLSASNTVQVPPKNIKVCMTGKLNDFKSRTVAAEYLEKNGIQVVSGVSKTLDYLVNEDNKASSKLSKAKEYNIPIVTIKQLIEEII